MVSSLWGIKGHVTRAYKKRICYQLRYSKYIAVKLAEKMYKPGCISLTRKRLKINKVLAMMGLREL